MLPKPQRRLAAERDRAEFVAIAARPATVVPGADDEVVDALRIVLLEGAVDAERTVEVLLVPPAGDIERRHRAARQLRQHRLRAPERVVVGVGDIVVPGWDAAAEVLFVDILQRAELQIPIKRVVAIETELFGRLRRLHHRCILKSIAESEGAIVMEVVTDPHIRRGRLW